MLDNRRLHPTTDEYHHAACNYGAFIAGVAVELRKLLAAACVTDMTTAAFGQRLEAVAHNMEANLGAPEFTEFMGIYKDRDFDADIASAAKTSTRQPFGGGHRCSHSDWEGGGGNRDNFKTARSPREVQAPRAAPSKDTTKDAGKGEAKAEASVADKAK
eukprot:jgi/Tetstr1/434655/TSEL_023746.t1